MGALPQPIYDVVLELERGLKDLYGERHRGLLLYGSYARGNAWEGSDVNLLLLLEGPVSPAQEILRLQPVKWPLCLDANLVLSVMPVDVDAFERGESMFLRIAHREAIPVTV